MVKRIQQTHFFFLQIRVVWLESFYNILKFGSAFGETKDVLFKKLATLHWTLPSGLHATITFFIDTFKVQLSPIATLGFKNNNLSL